MYLHMYLHNFLILFYFSDAYRTIHLGSPSTTNGIESLHKALKYSYLKLQGDGSVTVLVETLVRDFIPDIVLEYKRLNYMSTSQYKLYRPEIPDILHNRPKHVVMTLYKNMISAGYSKPTDVNVITDQLFEVKSESENIWYEVFLGDEIEKRVPSCECKAFRKNGLLCKHFFAVFQQTDKAWENVIDSYKNSPYLTLDQALLSNEIMDHNVEIKYEEVEEGQELESLIEAMKRMERSENVNLI